MEERDFFDEKVVSKPANLSCHYCRQTATYQVRWIERTKKNNLRGRADERDRAILRTIVRNRAGFLRYLLLLLAAVLRLFLGPG